jgi:hypothetical protein
MSYDDPIAAEYFNVHVRGDLDLHNRVNHFMVGQPKFQRYQAVKTMLAEGTFEVHHVISFELLEKLCVEKEELWQEIHRNMLAYVEGLAREA